MNFEIFIAKKIIRNKRKSFSRFIVGIATIAISLSMCVMIIAGSMVTGFQKEISKKIFGFWGHIQIKSSVNPNSYDEVPMSIHQTFYPALDTMKGVDHIQVSGIKPGILKTKEEVEGIIFKGIGKDFRRSFLDDYLDSGHLFYPNDSARGNDSLVISKTTADKLNIKVGDKLTAGIIRDNIYKRKLMTVCGIYNTGLAEYDSKFALIDIRKVQYFNNWSKDSVGGFEVFVNDISQMDAVEQKINNQYYSIDYAAKSIKHNPSYTNIFEWLDLQTINEQVIIILMIVVAIINMITALLILILERTNMIGMLKAMGSSNNSVQKIFLFNAAYIIGRGLLFGNILGIGLCLMQKQFGIIHLPEESYYLKVAPINFDFIYILLLNTGTLILCTLVMIIPTILVSRISPVRAIRFS